MAIQDRNTIKTWFETGDKPTQQQFWDWLDSYVHKNDGIAIGQVTGLDDLLNTLASQSSVDALSPILIAGATSSESVIVPAGSVLDLIRIKSDEAMTFSVGLTMGSKEILSDEEVEANTAGLYSRLYDFENDTTIYISGLEGSYVIKIVLK